MNAALTDLEMQRGSRAALARTGTVARYIWRPIAAPIVSTKRSLVGRSFWVLGGSAASGLQVTTELERAGARVLKPRLQTLGAEGIDGIDGIDGIVDLNLDEAVTLADRETWKLAIAHTLNALKAVYRDWSTETRAGRLSYLAVSRLGGAMGYRAHSGEGNPLGGIWAGLAKSLPREIPNLRVRALDLPLDCPDFGARVVSELATADNLYEVGWRGGERQTLASVGEPVGQATIALGTEDRVLISGGARGIGFALALALAERFGCNVVVTGRSSLDSSSSPWVRADQSEFEAYRLRRLKQPAIGEGIRAVRTEISALQRQRELLRNLSLVRARGLPIHYERCDFTALDSVRDLLSRVGPVSVLVHNAGVDTPLRLGGKSVATCLDTLSVKIDGFLNLMTTIPRAPLKAVCCVGSLTGRLGGMVGQIDYGAANEGLCRLAQHYAAELCAPLKTVCFPTWEHLGMVSNFEATLKYMTPLGVAEGVDHWLDELLSPGTGEVTFMGEVGPALSPVQLGAYPSVSELPGVERLRSLIFSAGETLAFVPQREYLSCLRLARDTSPCLQEFALDGQNALPISCLIELAWGAARWLTPPEVADTLSLTNLRVAVPLLAFTGPHKEVEFEVLRRGISTKIVVTDRPSGARIAHMSLAAVPPLTEPEGLAVDPARAVVMSWRHFLWQPPSRVADGDRVELLVRETNRDDVWLNPLAAEPQLPLTAIEALLFEQANAAPLGARVTELECSRLRVEARRAALQRIVFEPQSGNAIVTCAETSLMILEAQGLRLRFGSNG